MNEKLTAFLKAIVKYGGANLLLLIIVSYFFDSFFHVDPLTVQVILNWLLWILFFETIVVMVVGRVFWILQKGRDFQQGKDVVDVNGKSTTDLLKEIGVDTLVSLKDKLAKSPEKEREKIKKQIAKIEAELKALE